MPDPAQYEQVARRIAGYLACRQQPDGSFAGPENYGVAAALWLWSYFGEEFGEQTELAARRLESQPPTSHGEFNAYALLQYRDRAGPGLADSVLRRIHFGRRHSANWMLLRAVCRSRSESRLSRARALLEARTALACYLRRGLIADRAGIRSFAYHCFCGALLADLWRETGWRWAAAGVADIARFIAPFVLPNGDTLYVGRGQQQIFGYGALLYLLEAAARMMGDGDLRSHADPAFGYLTSFQRPDGSFPLVLNDDEPVEPWAPGLRPGWYSYNRYADYLPFLGCMLMRAAEPQLPRCANALSPLSQHPDFHIHHEPRYTAVLSRPGGATTNDLAFPYVVVDGISLFPCYGAEGSAPPEAMPLPFGVLSDGRVYGFRDHLRYRLEEGRLTGESALVSHSREFQFCIGGFVCRDQIAFRRRRRFAAFAPANFVFRNLQARQDGRFETSHRGSGALIRADHAMSVHPDVGTSASGQLVALRHCIAPFEAAAGEVISAELRVQFT